MTAPTAHAATKSELADADDLREGSEATISMNILLLFPHFQVPSQPGGVRSWQIARFLAARGHRVTVLAPGSHNRTGQVMEEMRGRLFWETEVDGVRLIRAYALPNFRKNVFRRILNAFSFSMLSFLRALRLERPDVVVAAYPTALLPVFGFLLTRLYWLAALSRKRPVAFVYEVRDLMVDALKALHLVRSRVMLNIAFGLEAFIERHCDHVIVVSEGIRRVLMGRGVAENKITVVPNGYESEVFEQAPVIDDVREQYGWADRFVVVYAGGLTQAYDVASLLKAARALQEKGRDDVLICIIGEGERKKEYQQWCLDNQLQNVQFLDYRPRREVPPLLKAADVGVHLFPDDPLWSYVLGNKPFDYLGAGLPMIYAGTGDTADLIRRANAGLVVEPENVSALTESILRLENDRDLAKELGSNGEVFVKTYCRREDQLPAFERALLRSKASLSPLVREEAAAD